MIKSLLHIGIYTLNLEESIRFYCDGLGFSLRWQGVVPHPSGQLPVATVVLEDCVIELVHPADESRFHRLEGPVQHLALLVEDLDATLLELASRGITLDEEVSEILYEGGIRHCFIRGPGNERIELGEPL
jgi:catechol 2,3-dioxygenase-like lactoylglutathione lyase family enzyme